MIKFLTNGGDATDAFREFHGRSKKANAMLKARPNRPAPDEVRHATLATTRLRPHACATCLQGLQRRSPVKTYSPGRTVHAAPPPACVSPTRP